MTIHQWQTIERSLIGLSPQDKLELVEHLLHELRVVAASGTQSPAPRIAEMTEDEFKQQLLKSGRVSSLPTPADPASRPVFQPITLEGEPLSETIIRERR
ncbi:MAG: hypothetical protein ABSH35_00090 [Isosphaeraceae bacterium]|jgi:hypothetical protein